jgi:hypothetical protein
MCHFNNELRTGLLGIHNNCAYHWYFIEVKFINLNPKNSKLKTNSFRPNSQRCMYMHLRQTIFIGLVFAQLFSVMHEKHVIQQPKTLIFMIMKILRSYTE